MHEVWIKRTLTTCTHAVAQRYWAKELETPYGATKTPSMQQALHTLYLPRYAKSFPESTKTAVNAGIYPPGDDLAIQHTRGSYDVEKMQFAGVEVNVRVRTEDHSYQRNLTGAQMKDPHAQPGSNTLQCTRNMPSRYSLPVRRKTELYLCCESLFLNFQYMKGAEKNLLTVPKWWSMIRSFDLSSSRLARQRQNFGMKSQMDLAIKSRVR